MRADTSSAMEASMDTKGEAFAHADSDFLTIGTLRAESAKLVACSGGQIIEDPPLLQQFSALCEAIDGVLGDGLRLGEIRITQSYYIAEIQGVAELDGQHGRVAEILELVKQFDDSRIRLEANCRRETPAAADECGVDGKRLGVLRVASDLADAGCAVEFTLPGHGTVQLPAPNAKAFTALPAANKHKNKKVDGEITAIGRGDGRGSRLEIAKRSMYLVAGLELEEAWRLMKAQAHLQGTAQWVEDGYIITNPVYASRLVG